MIKEGVSRLVIFFLYLLSLLPFWILYLLSDFLYLIIFYVVRYRRKVVQSNLLNAFPHKTQKERDAIEKKYFKYLADMIVETLKLITISEKEVIKRVKFLNPEIVENYFNQGKSIIGAVGHYCNWEIAALRFSFMTDNRRIIVYKPLSNKKADDYYNKIRGRFGAMLVPMKKTLRVIAEYRNELTFTVLVSDQTPVKHEAHYFTTFLNQPTAVFLGVEKIAKMTDSAVIFCDLQRVKRGYYEYTLVSLTDNAKQTQDYEITNAHVKYLEQMIINKPEYWLWSHRRWKFKPEDVHK